MLATHQNAESRYDILRKETVKAATDIIHSQGVNNIVIQTIIWEKQRLIGLSLGRPTYAASALRLDFVEASPLDLGERPSIIEYILLGYDIYARMLNAKQIRIMNPINKTILAYYEKFGYEYYAKGDFLYRSIF